MLVPSLDPANPFGLLLPWPAQPGISFSRKSGNYLVMKGRHWLYWIEHNGKRIYRIQTQEESSETSPICS